jgi:hypothetical protein
MDVIQRRMRYEEYVDESFAPDLADVQMPLKRLPMPGPGDEHP